MKTTEKLLFKVFIVLNVVVYLIKLEGELHFDAAYYETPQFPNIELVSEKCAEQATKRFVFGDTPQKIYKKRLSGYTPWVLNRYTLRRINIHTNCSPEKSSYIFISDLQFFFRFYKYNIPHRSSDDDDIDRG